MRVNLPALGVGWTWLWRTRCNPSDQIRLIIRGPRDPKAPSDQQFSLRGTAWDIGSACDGRVTAIHGILVLCAFTIAVWGQPGGMMMASGV